MMLHKDFIQIIMGLTILTIIAVATLFIPKIAFIFGISIVLYGLYRTVVTRNNNGVAHVIAAFLVGSEVYFRMSFAGLPWEFGKMAVFLLLVVGMLVEKRKRTISLVILLYFLLLLPGVFVPEWNSVDAFKREFMFTFFGEVVLVVSVLYFFRRQFVFSQLRSIARAFVYGVFLMSITILFKSPNYAQIHYTTAANFVASGGFGPNQVSAIFGLGIITLSSFLLMNVRLFFYRWLDWMLLILFILQAFFTFSRGGLISAFFALFITVLILYFTSPQKTVRVLHLSFGRFALLSIVFLIIFVKVNDITQGALEKRYLNVNEYGQVIKEDYTTHRADIVKEDWQTFLDHFVVGTGIGGGREYREEKTGISAAHVELSRLPAEHGILGFIALMILLFYPIYTFFKLQDIYSRFFLILFTAYGILTMSHNALRLALPSFVYGLGFIWVIFEHRYKS